MHGAWRKAADGIVLVLGFGGVSWADDSHNRGASQHGGTVEKTTHYQFEIVFTAVGIKVYPSGMEGKSLDISKLTGKATFYHPTSPKAWFDRPLGSVPASPGQAPASLACTIDLSKVPAQGAKVTFEINGLPDPAEPAASFTVSFTLTQAPAVARPGPETAAITYAKATRADQPAINAQRVCKVSGEALGSMGVPTKVTRGNNSVFLCCQGCLKTLMANPDRFLGRLAANETNEKR